MPKVKVDDDDYMAEEAASVEVGARCEVEGGRRGEVMYVGKCEGLKGFWVGVKVGKQSGGEGWEGATCVSKRLHG